MSSVAGWFGERRLGAETRLRWMLARPRGKVAPGRASPKWRAEASDLILSEWLVLAGLALAVLWAWSNHWVPVSRVAGVSHFPGAVFLLGFALTLVGGLMFRSRVASHRSMCPPSHTLWPLLLLSAFILAGSTYAQYVDKVSNTFRIAGAYMWVAYMLARVVMVSANPQRLVMGYYVLLAVAAVPTVGVMSAYFAMGRGIEAPFHQLEVFVLPLAVFWVTRKRQASGLAVAGFWAVVACAVVFRKNTSYLVAMGMVIYTWLFHWRPNITRKTALRAQLAVLLGALVLVFTVGAYFYLRHTSVHLVPEGNTEYRLTTYARAWQRFLESPVWGAAYLQPAAEKFEGYEINITGGVLLSHSDLLDLLAHGGLIGAALWALAHVLLLRAVYDHILSRRDEIAPNILGLTHMLVCMVLMGIVTYAFNPMWLGPAMALLLWANLGLLAGLVAVYARAPKESVDKSGQ